VFMKDFDIHGCNVRLVRFFAQSPLFFRERGVQLPIYVITLLDSRKSKIDY
jgi:hypothetical protein